MGPTKKILARARVGSDDFQEQKLALDRNWTVYHEIFEHQTLYGGYLPDNGEVFGLSLRTEGLLERNFRQFLERINFLS